MLENKYLVFVPGLILAFVLYSLSQGFNNVIGIEFFGYSKSPISTAMIAILLGMFFGNIFKVRDSFQKGLDFTREYILKMGIICLGIQLKPFEFLEFGKIAIPLIVVCIISVLVVIKTLIKKLKIPTRMAYLISFRFVDNPIAAIAIVRKIFDKNLIKPTASLQLKLFSEINN